MNDNFNDEDSLLENELSQKRKITDPLQTSEINNENQRDDAVETDKENEENEDEDVPVVKNKTVDDKKVKMIVVVVVVCVLCAVVGGIIGGLIVRKTVKSMSSESLSTTQNVQAFENGTVEPKDVKMPDTPTTKQTLTTVAPQTKAEITTMRASTIYKRNLPSCVGIVIETGTAKIMGSGFIITSDGYIVTNNHVVDGFDTCKVVTWDNSEYDGRVVGTDDVNDVAIVKIDKNNASCVTFGSSNELNIGDPIYVIGNPLGDLTFTMTSGIVSAVNRTVTVASGMQINMFQTDAAINSGNSGGAVFDENGKVVGIATAKLASSEIEGLCFCIPIDDVKQMLEQLRITGYVSGRAFMGVEVTDKIVQSRLIFSTVQQINGAMIVSIVPNSVASSSSLQKNDIIIRLNKTTITSVASLKSALSLLKPGETAEALVYRAGQEITLKVSLEEYTPQKAGSPTADNTTIL